MKPTTSLRLRLALSLSALITLHCIAGEAHADANSTFSLTPGSSTSTRIEATKSNPDGGSPHLAGVGSAAGTSEDLPGWSGLPLTPQREDKPSERDWAVFADIGSSDEWSIAANGSATPGTGLQSKKLSGARGVPLPAAFWLFGPALFGFVVLARRRI